MPEFSSNPKWEQQWQEAAATMERKLSRQESIVEAATAYVRTDRDDPNLPAAFAALAAAVERKTDDD